MFLMVRLTVTPLEDPNDKTAGWGHFFGVFIDFTFYAEIYTLIEVTIYAMSFPSLQLESA